MKKSILIINRNKTNNLGDQAIGKAMLRLFSSQQTEIMQADLCLANASMNLNLTGQNPKSSIRKRIIHTISAKLSRIRILKELNWWRTNQGIFTILKSFHFDVILIGGGELCQSNWLFPLSICKWIEQIRLMQDSSTKVYLFGVGCTDKWTSIDKKRMNKALTRINHIYVRDMQSKANMSSVFGRDSLVIPDVVYSSKVAQSVASRKYDLVGITTFSRISKYGIYAKTYADYFSKSLAIIDELCTHGSKDICLFYTTQEDYQAATQFMLYYKQHRSQPIAMAQIRTLADLEVLLDNANQVYSPRMHGCILAQLHGCKPMPIHISPKMESYSKTYIGMSNLADLKKQLTNAANTIINS